MKILPKSFFQISCSTFIVFRTKIQKTHMEEVTILACHSLFVGGPCSINIKHGKIDYMGMELDDSRVFEEDVEYLFDSPSGAVLYLSTLNTWFIMKNCWISQLQRHTRLQTPRIQMVVSQQPFLVETIKNYYSRKGDSITILDLQGNNNHFTPFSTVGFTPNGPLFFCKPSSTNRVIEDKIWEAIQSHLEVVRQQNTHVVIHTGSFRGCTDNYDQFRRFLEQFGVQHVLVSDDERCFYTQKCRTDGSIEFTRIAPYQKIRGPSTKITPKKIHMPLSNVKGVVSKSIYPPQSCLPMGNYTRVMKPVYISDSTCLKTDQTYGVSPNTELNPLDAALPITAVVKALERGRMELLWGVLPSHPNTVYYLIE